MEIRQPNGPMQSAKTFAIQVGTVLLAILIALGLQAAVQWTRHRALVRDARTNIAAEIEKNKATVEKAVATIPRTEDELKAIIAAMQQLEDGREFGGELRFGFTNYNLPSTAWKTAASSGAVTHMDYDELTRYTALYDLQQDFLNRQQEEFRALTELSRLPSLLDQDAKKVPADQFRQMEDAATRALFVETTLHEMAKSLDKQYQALPAR
jgi:hypothetical protein